MSVLTGITLVWALVVITAAVILLLPAIVAFYRQHKYRWVILVLALIPLWGVTWVAAMIWAVWPNKNQP